jgi:gliding motility-associated-like protein
MYPNVGTYEVCLIIESITGCKDTICDTIEIIPPELTTPNVISPNGDNQNDVLYFEYLPFFGVSHLMVFNRWGMKVYESKDYQNNWDGGNCVDGTYYYVIEIPGGKVYTRTLSIFRN